MEIVLLGTGSPIPDANRAGPATLVRADAPILFDCGRGVVLRLAAAGALPPALGGVVLTHLHSDHLSALNDVITTHWVMNPGPVPLVIAGPVGTKAVVAAIEAMLAPDMQYRLDHHADLNHRPLLEVHELEPDDEIELAGARLVAGRTDHRPVQPTLGYRVEHQGKAVVIAGDGVPCDELDELCRGADAYVQTVIRDDIVRLVPSERFQDICDYHSTVEQAAQTAKRTGVGTLVLTHYVPAPPVGAEAEWVAPAGEHFDGPIVAGPDLTSLTI